MANKKKLGRVMSSIISNNQQVNRENTEKRLLERKNKNKQKLLLAKAS